VLHSLLKASMRRERNATLSSHMPLSFLSFCHGSTALVDLGLLDEVTRLDTHTLDRTPLDEWSSRRRERYIITHNTKQRHPLVVLEPENSSKRAAVDPLHISSGHCLAHTIFGS